MASIVVASIPVHGHVTPLLSVAENFVRRGDDVRFITGSRFADRVRATGAAFLPLPREADFDVQDVISRFPERTRLKGVKALAFDIEKVFAGPAKAQYQALLSADATRPADAMLTDPAFVGAAFLLEHPRSSRPAVIMCGVLPLSIESRDTAPYGLGLPPARTLNRQRNAALTLIHRHLLSGAHQRVNDQYREVHGKDIPTTLVDWGRRAEALVQFSVSSFEYPRSDAPSTLHFAGPLSATGSHAALPGWWPDLDGTRPIVHVTQGTVANTDYGQAIAPTLRALADEEVLVTVSTGGRPVDTLPPLPANARAASYLPYDELLPRTGVFVTNGGYGGVQYALRYGVPIVATGGKEDKPEVGARVSWSGVGRRVRTEHPSPRALRRAILTVLDEPRYRRASAQVAAEMAATPGFTGLAGIVATLIADNPRGVSRNALA